MARIFISHSSKDKVFVTNLIDDLKHLGHQVWLDEYAVKVGECIVSGIESGLHNAEYVVLVVSPNSVKSGWVEREWKTKFWDEVNSGRTLVLPVLIASCDIPELLKTKRYADFRTSYAVGLVQLATSFDPLINAETTKRLAAGHHLSRSSPTRKVFAILGLLLICAAITALVKARIPTGPNSNLLASISQVPLEGGTFKFASERFQRIETSKNTRESFVYRSDRSQNDSLSEETTELGLTFHLINSSNHPVTIAALRVVPLGTIITYEDQPEPVGKIFKGTDLGTVEYSLSGQPESSFSSDSLLSSNKIFELGRNSFKSYLVRIRCRKNWNSFSLGVTSGLPTPEPIARTADFGDSIVSGNAHPNAGSLESLDRGQRKVDRAAHVFVVEVEILMDTGERRRIYSDRIYTVYPRDQSSTLACFA